MKTDFNGPYTLVLHGIYFTQVWSQSCVQHSHCALMILDFRWMGNISENVSEAIIAAPLLAAAMIET